MNDSDYEDWLEGFTSVPLTDEELEQIKSGERPLTNAELRNLIQEVTFLRYLASELVKQCEERPETSEKNKLLGYAKSVLAARGNKEKK